MGLRLRVCLPAGSWAQRERRGFHATSSKGSREVRAHANRQVFSKTVSVVISTYTGLAVGSWFSLNGYLSTPLPSGECQMTP